MVLTVIGYVFVYVVFANMFGVLLRNVWNPKNKGKAIARILFPIGHSNDDFGTKIFVNDKYSGNDFPGEVYNPETVAYLVINLFGFPFKLFVIITMLPASILGIIMAREKSKKLTEIEELEDLREKNIKIENRIAELEFKTTPTAYR